MRTTRPRVLGHVIAAQLDHLHAAGFPLIAQDITDECPRCRCPLGSHEALLPADLTALDLLDSAGWIECPSCDQGCGTWTVHLPGWS